MSAAGAQPLVARLGPAPQTARASLSAPGILLFLAAVLVTGSASTSLRFDVGGLLFHPYLAVVGPLFLWTLRDGLARLPRGPMVALVAFLGIYFFSTLPESGGFSEVIKVGAAALAMITAAMAIRTERDFTAAVLGLSIAAALIGAQGLVGADSTDATGINPTEGVGNKNAYSLYALPAVLLAGHVGLDPRSSKRLRIALLVCVLIAVVALFSTANRSGWLGLVLIGALLSFRAGRRVRGVLVIGALAAAAMYLVTTYGNVEVIERRLRQTEEGYYSDTVRQQLVSSAFEIAADNPVLGVTPQRLPLELARRVPSRHLDEAGIDPHNTVALIVGGAGFLALIAFFWIAWTLVRPARGATRQYPAAREAHTLLRAMILLWAVRSLFTREILYNPGFALGVGICIGLCAIRGAWLAPGAQPEATSPQGDLS